MTGWVVGLCGLLGLFLGSFATVVIQRVPEGGSLVRPPSSCPVCGSAISPRDNIPVLSWLLLRGRCRTCGEPISARYPLVELAGGILFAIVAWWIAGMDPPDWYALPGYLLFVWTLLVVTVIDARTRRIPNRLTYPLTPALAVLLCGAALLNGDPAQALRTLAGGVIAGAVLLVLALINPRGMGMGDVKFAPFLGMGLAYLGWDALAVGIFGAFLIGGVVSIGLLALKLRGRKDLLPFGPYLAAGALAGLLFGPALFAGYRDMLGI